MDMIKLDKAHRDLHAHHDEGGVGQSSPVTTVGKTTLQFRSHGGNPIPTDIDLSMGQEDPMFLDSYMELDLIDMRSEFLDTFNRKKGLIPKEGQDEDG